MTVPLTHGVTNDHYSLVGAQLLDLAQNVHKVIPSESISTTIRETACMMDDVVSVMGRTARWSPKLYSFLPPLQYAASIHAAPRIMQLNSLPSQRIKAPYGHGKKAIVAVHWPSKCLEGWPCSHGMAWIVARIEA